MWEKSATHYLARKIPGILAEKWTELFHNSRREPAYLVYFPKILSVCSYTMYFR